MKFSYSGYDRAGTAVSATLDAASLADARDSLRRQNIFASDVQPVSNSKTAADSKHRATRLSTGKRLKGLAMFAKQLHVLISSGTPLVQALSAIERQCEYDSWTTVIIALREKVEEGAPLSEGMRQHPRHFDTISRSLVSAGEASGNLPQMLERLAVLTRKQSQLRGMIAGAMVYPCVLICIGISALLTMLMFVLPRFTILFQSLDSPLPPTTKMLLWISGMLWGYWWLMLAIILAAAFTARLWLFSNLFRRLWADLMLAVPKVEKLTRSMMTARIARMLGTLLESRVSLTDALQLTREVAAHPRYAALLTAAEQAVERGEPISAVLSESHLISPCVQETLRNGETSGKLGEPLIHMADFLDEENDVVVKALSSIIEPAILLVLGVIVGFIAVSMFLPMFDLVSAAQRG